MFSTRGKKPGRLKKSFENKATENASSEKQTSDSGILEDGVKLAEFEDKEGITFAKDRNNEYGTEETEKVTDADQEDENTTEAATNGKVESEENTSDNEDEADDQEDEMWEDDDDDEDSEDNAKSLVDKDTIGKDEAIEETSEEEAIEEDSEEVEYSEASMEEDDEEQEHTQKDELTKVKDSDAKPVGKDNEEQDVQKAKISSTKMEKSIESSGKLKMEKSSESSGKFKKMEKASESSGKFKKMEKASESSGKLKMEKSSERSGKKVQGTLPKKVGGGDKSESSSKQKTKKRVESMGMIFMCSAMTKDECYQYKVLGLPESKKDIVEKIYTGMRLFLYDVDLKLLYGIYKAAGPGGFNIEPKAFKSQFPSQVRFTILDDCLPLAEEKFKKVIKENYFTNSKFECQLNSEQVRKLCRLFLAKRKGKQSKKFVRQLKSGKRQPARREGPGKQRAGIKRPQASKEDLLSHAYPRKRPRKVTSSAAPLHRSPRASLSPTLRLYAYGRTTDANAYRRDSYLESRSHYRERRDPIISRRDPYRDWRDAPPTELDRYRDGRDVALVSRYHDRDKHDPYLGRRDHFRDAGDPYPERRDPYRDGRDSYIDRHNTYRDGRDAYLKIRDSDRDKRDSYLDRRGSYIDRSYLAPYGNDRRDPLADRDIVHREVPGVDYRDSYRREEVSDLRLGLETRQRHDIGSRDSYATYLRSSAYAEPVYSSEYPPPRLATGARQYHI